MTDGSRIHKEFLADLGVDHAVVRPLAGDASLRKYYRVFGAGPDESMVLMDAPEATCGSLKPFVDIASHLIHLGLSPPRIIYQNREMGLLLIEDLGDELYSSLLKKNPAAEIQIYTCAIEVLAKIRHSHPPKGIPEYSASVQGDLAALSLDWYSQNITDTPIDPAIRETLVHRVASAVDSLGRANVFIHRDYHADNLVWLSNRQGLERVGLLDFQDGALGHWSYDLVSLLEDARRDVSLSLRQKLIHAYHELTNETEEAIVHAMAISGIQRNLRIMGVFARLSIRDAKPHYVDLIPRVWGYLTKDIEIANQAEIEAIVKEYMPEPNPDNLNRLRRRT